ncbi:MAG: substrate-binding domain-containing protein [Treponema sp.]|jgi:rhamnose transport system substrate-binding protein|nr:substrate-binding domain-containing protein [Treponema sp.]
MKMMKKAAFVALCLVAALACLSCQGKADSGTAAAARTAASDVLKIYFIPNNLGNPYFDALSSGFQQAITELGAGNFEYHYVGPASAGATDQIEYIEAAVQNRAFAIFLAANSEDALNATLDDARAAGVRLYIINQDIPGSESHRDAAIMPVDFDKIGDAQIELMGGYINYEGEFAILSATTSAPDQNYWIEGMKAALAANSKYANMTLVDVVYGDDQPEKSTTEMEALLNKYPNLKGVICPTTVGIAASTKVVQTRKVADKVKVTGLGLPSEMKQYVEDGTSPGFQLWDPPKEGYMAVYMCWEEKNGSFKPAPGASFNAGKYGSMTIRSNGQIMALDEPKTFDATNLQDFVY